MRRAVRDRELRQRRGTEATNALDRMRNLSNRAEEYERRRMLSLVDRPHSCVRMCASARTDRRLALRGRRRLPVRRIRLDCSL
jgi:hypothetical protein